MRWSARLVVCGAAATACSGSSTPSPEETLAACEQVSLRDLVPQASRFVPGSVVRLQVTAADRGGGECRAALQLTILDIHDTVHAATVDTVLAGGERVVELTWPGSAEDFHGYTAVVTAPGSDALSTGIDISSTPTRYPRFGFVTRFGPEEPAARSEELIRVLAQQFHLNMFQFYDWFWRHEDLIPPDAATWTDLFRRENAAATIADLIAAVHEYGGFAFAYVTAYAAREGYEQQSDVSPAWGLFETPDAQRQVALAFPEEQFLFLFDPSNARWQARMASEYTDALRQFNFDGVQIDQFGPRPTLYRADGSPVELNSTFGPFLEAIDRALAEAVPGRDRCIFNLVDGSVDGYAVREVAASSACDILYSEIWFQTDTYDALRDYIEQLRAIGRERAVVLAVYAQYGEDVGTILQAEMATLAGVETADDHANYTGDGFVDAFDAPGDSITWTIDLSEDANVSFVFRYANATGTPATRTLVVDGTPIGKLRFGALATWDQWSFDAWLQQRLVAGSHRVSLVFEEDDTGAVNIDRLTLGEFDEDSVRLQNAVIFASGATPIQIGDDVQSLAHEYFPNRSKTLRPSLQRALRSQYSFITAHEELLFAPEVVPIANVLEAVSGHQLIKEGAGGIWWLARHTPAGDAIHLVNLVGVDNARWRDAAPTPTTQSSVRLRYAVADPTAVCAVSWATPDDAMGTFQRLEFVTGDGWIEFVVPSLTYWDMILVQAGPDQCTTSAMPRRARGDDDGRVGGAP